MKLSFALIAATLVAMAHSQAVSISSSEFWNAVCSPTATEPPLIEMYDPDGVYSYVDGNGVLRLRETLDQGASLGTTVCDFATLSDFTALYTDYNAAAASCAVTYDDQGQNIVLFNIALAEPDAPNYAGQVQCAFRVDVKAECYVAPTGAPTPAPTPAPTDDETDTDETSDDGVDTTSDDQGENEDNYARRLGLLKAAAVSIKGKANGLQDQLADEEQADEEAGSRKRQIDNIPCYQRRNYQHCTQECSGGPLGVCQCLWDHPLNPNWNEQLSIYSTCPDGYICCWNPPCARWDASFFDPNFDVEDFQRFCFLGGGGRDATDTVPAIASNCELYSDNQSCICVQPLLATTSYASIFGEALNAEQVPYSAPFDCSCPYMELSLWIALGASQSELACTFDPTADPDIPPPGTEALTSQQVALLLREFHEFYYVNSDACAEQVVEVTVESTVVDPIDPAVIEVCQQLINQPLPDCSYRRHKTGCGLVTYRENAENVVAQVSGTANSVLSDRQLLPASSISVKHLRPSAASSLTASLLVLVAALFVAAF